MTRCVHSLFLCNLKNVNKVRSDRCQIKCSTKVWTPYFLVERSGKEMRTFITKWNLFKSNFYKLNDFSKFSATSIINLLNGIAQILSRNQSNLASSSENTRQVSTYLS